MKTRQGRLSELSGERLLYFTPSSSTFLTSPLPSHLPNLSYYPFGRTNRSVFSHPQCAQFRRHMLPQQSNLESAPLTPMEARQSVLHPPHGLSFRMRAEVDLDYQIPKPTSIVPLFARLSALLARLDPAFVPPLSLAHRPHVSPALMTTRIRTSPYCYHTERPGATYRYSTFGSATPPCANYSFDLFGTTLEARLSCPKRCTTVPS